MLTKLAYSPNEAAELVGVGRTLIFAEIKAGRLNARKAVSRTLITKTDLEAWLNNLPSRVVEDEITNSIGREDKRL